MDKDSGRLGMNKRYKLDLDEGIKFILFTTICIVLFMIITPSMLIKSKGIKGNELSEVDIETEQTEPTASTVEIKDITLSGDELHKIRLLMFH